MTEHRRGTVSVAGPTDARPPFVFVARTRVAFSDTDAQSIVYYGRYAPYFDLARLEYLRWIGLDPKHPTSGAAEFAMRHFDIDYHAPAAFDDPLAIYVRVAAIGNTSVTFEFEVVSDAGDDRVLATARQVLVCVDLAQRRPMRVPDAFRDAIPPDDAQP